MTANEAFFQRKQAAAILKHGILSRYPTVFASMTGSTSTGGRVVYLDGYAGPGRYEPEQSGTPGAPGSPLLAVQFATRVASWQRDVRCLFIERNQKYVENLRRVLAEEAPESLFYRVLEGDVEQRLDDALEIADDDPLLVFLDPFGTALPCDVMIRKLFKRHASLKTEVMLNLNIEMVSRIGGLLTGEETDAEHTRAGESATLERVDRFLGGNWWRDTFRRARVSGERGSAARAAQQVATEFCQRIQDETGFRSFSVPIRRRPSHPPLFLLILFYRHPTAPYEFSQAASKANEEWRHQARQRDLAEELERLHTNPGLFGDEFAVHLSEQTAEKVEKGFDTEWIAAIDGNIRRLLRDTTFLKVETAVENIYGATLGLARDKHLLRAWDQLAGDGVVLPRQKSKKLRTQTIRRA